MKTQTDHDVIVRHRHKSVGKTSTFTLIELLVVVAIIGVLASMLLPALSKARESARRIVCASQLKQIQAAVFLYTSDNDDFLPALGMYPLVFGANPRYDEGNWYGALSSYLGDPNGNDSRHARLGWRAFPVDLSRVEMCPSSTNNTLITTPSGYYTNYGYNRCVLITPHGIAGAARISDISEADRTFSVFDGNYLGMEHTAYLTSRVTWFAHNFNANFAFMDGHVDQVGHSMQYNWNWFANRRLNNSTRYFW